MTELRMRIGGECSFDGWTGKRIDDGVLLRFPVLEGLVVDVRCLCNKNLITATQRRGIAREVKLYTDRWPAGMAEVPMIDFARAMVECDSHWLKDFIWCIASGFDHILDLERLAWHDERKVPAGAPSAHMQRAETEHLTANEMASFNLINLFSVWKRNLGGSELFCGHRRG